MNKFIKQLGFTLVEMIIVVVIIGITAGFAIPNYQKSVEKSYERQAYLNLMTIHAAQTMQKAKTGKYFSGASGIAAINASMGLSIPESEELKFHYQCAGAGDEFWFACVARRRPVWESWEVAVGNDPGCYPPCCTDESTLGCPSLPICVGAGACLP